MEMDVGLQNAILIGFMCFAILVFILALRDAFLKQDRKSNILFSVSTIPLVVIGIEITLRILFIDRQIQPVFNVLYLEPHPQVGWIHPIDFKFTWRGFDPACVEFDQTIMMNQWGFRDEKDWTHEKPNDTIRIALIGDSLVEALQVEKTAAMLLQDMLADRYPDQRFEVMNFGVSNYSVAQFQLMYEHIVRDFEPDVVVILVAYFHMRRTPQQHTIARMSDMDRLSVRPSYRLDDGELVFVSATDYDRYVQSLETSLADEFGEDRSIAVNPGMTLRTFQLLRGELRLPMSLHPPRHPSPPGDEFSVLDLNYAILERLAEHVQSDDAQLIFIDIFDYLEDFAREEMGSGVLVEQNLAFAEANDMGYVNLSTVFRQANDRIQFPCDGHFTSLGNQLFAEAIFEWVSEFVIE